MAAADPARGSVLPAPGSAAGGVNFVSLSKRFGPVQALEDVTFDVARGEIHALCGGNGSGKSTLIKAVSGLQPADKGGALIVDGHEYRAEEITPVLSAAAGIRAVQQDLGLFHDMTVAENIALGSTFPTRLGRIRKGDLHRQADALLERFSIDAAPTDLLGDLGRVAQTQVAIARVLQDHLDEPRGLLILDEPTASLPIEEVEMLLTALKSYAAAGQSILYVSHRLDEILTWTDRTSILRDGRYQGTYASADLDEGALVELITGRAVASLASGRRAVPESSDVVARLKDVDAGPLRGIDLEVRAGEILGIAGLQGSGRTELLQVMFGVQRVERGAVELDGEPVVLRGPLAAMNAGVAMVPEDRVHESSFADMTIDENMSISVLSEYWRGGFFRRGRIKADSWDLADRFGVKVADVSDPLTSLSGGNQQKVILSRWIRREPRLLLLDEPTQGVDVGARSDIYAIVREVARAGTAVVVVASDLEELALVADRVVVLRQGRITAEVEADDIHAYRLTDLIYGKDIA